MNKKLFLVLFGLSVLILPKTAEGAMCSCVYDTRSVAFPYGDCVDCDTENCHVNCSWIHEVTGSPTKSCLLGKAYEQSEGLRCIVEDQCNRNDMICHSTTCPDTPSSSPFNGQNCYLRATCGFSCYHWGNRWESGEANLNEVNLKWDAYDDKCISCNSDRTENKVYADKTEIYVGCNDSNIISGDGRCESACGASPECDEQLKGPISGGTCNSNCIFDPYIPPPPPPNEYQLIVSKAGVGTGTVWDTEYDIYCGDDCYENYDEGAYVELVASVDPGYWFANWSGCNSVSGTHCYVTMNSDRTVTAYFGQCTSGVCCNTSDYSFRPSSYICNYNINPSYYCSGSACGDDVWKSSYYQYCSGNSASCTGSTTGPYTTLYSNCNNGQKCISNTCTKSPDCIRTLTLEKGGDGIGTVYSSPSGISCNTSCLSGSAEFSLNESVTLTATAGLHSSFSSWLGCNSIDANNRCLVTMNSSKTVTATFTAEYKLTVVRSGSGSVSSNPSGISCPSDCTEYYISGNSVTLTATPNLGYAFTGWSGAGINCLGTGTCTITMDSDKTVTATFLTAATLTVTTTNNNTAIGTVTSNPAGINCGTGGSDCSEDYLPNIQVILAVSTSPTSTFIGWGGDGSSCGSNTTCTVTMNADKTISATFDSARLSVYKSKVNTGDGTVTGNGISCGNNCQEYYPLNAQVILTATPDAISTFTGWSGTGINCPGTGTCTITMDSSKSVTATFTSYRLTVSSNYGTVTSDIDGINCGSDCIEYYIPNTSVILTAVPSTGYTFTGWSSSCFSANGNECIVVMDDNKLVTATYAKLYTLTVTKGGDGMGKIVSDPVGIDCGTECTSQYAYNTPVTLTAIADQESIFTGWGGSCSGSNATCIVTMNTNRSVTANFIIPKLNVNKDDSTGFGTITSFPTGIDCGSDCTSQQASYVYNTEVTLTAIPDANSAITNWSGGGCSGTSNACTVTMDDSKTVTVTFTSYELTVRQPTTNTGLGTTISDPPGINCGIDCTSQFTYFSPDTEVTLTATPNATSAVTEWSLSSCVDTATTCAVAMTQDRIVTVTFTSYQLTVSKIGTGSGTVISELTGIDCGADCTEYYAPSTSVVLTAVPESSTSTFTSWSGCNSTDGTKCYVTMTASKTVKATFTSYILTVEKNGTGLGTVTSSPAGINCGADCTEHYEYGTEVTLTAEPNSTSSITNWSGGGCSGTGNTCTVTMDDSKTVTVTFTTYRLRIYKYNYTFGTVVSDPPGIYCGTNCQQEYGYYAYNTEVVLTAIAEENTLFTGWSGEGCSGTDTCTVIMDQTYKIVYANFYYSALLTVSKSGGGTGRIFSTETDPVIDCDTTCMLQTASYSRYSNVTLKATADTDSAFTGWSGNCTGTGDCNLYMNSNKSVTANFNETIAPIVSVIPNPPNVTTYWQNTDAIAIVSCSDSGGSGCIEETYKLKTYTSNPVTCSNTYNDYSLSSPQTISSHVWICGTAKDNNGNTGFSSPVEFKVDKINPVSSIYRSSDGSWVADEGNSWHKTNLTRRSYDYDEGSGLDKCYYYVYDHIADQATTNILSRTCSELLYDIYVSIGSGKNCPNQSVTGEGGFVPACSLYIYSVDEVGNSSDYGVASYYVDWEAPVVGTVSPTIAEEGTEQMFYTTVSDNLEVEDCTFYAEKSDGSDEAVSTVHFYSNACGEGEELISCPADTNCVVCTSHAFGNIESATEIRKAYFTCGDHYLSESGSYLNIGTGEEQDIIITENSPPEITYGPYYDPSPCTSPTPQCAVKFEVEATDPDGDDLNYTWIFGDGSTGEGQYPSHLYSAVGTYPAIVTVSDGRGGTDNGGISVLVTENQIPNLPPSCQISVPGNGMTNQIIEINVSGSSDPEGLMTGAKFSSDNNKNGSADGSWTDYYYWQFSSGDWNAVNKTMKWSFASAGTYEVWAEVKDANNQTASCYDEISINECTTGDTQDCTSAQGCSHTITCQTNGTWPYCPTDVCSSGSIQDCPDGTQTCSASCSWGPCVPTGNCSLPAPSCPVCNHPVCSESGSWSCQPDSLGTDCGDCKECNGAGSCNYICAAGQVCINDICESCSLLDGGCGYGKCGIWEVPIWSFTGGVCQYGCQYDADCEGENPPQDPEEPCQRNIPDVYLEPYLQLGHAGQDLYYLVSVVNNDSTNCNSSSFSLTGNCPFDEWICYLSTPSLNILPGQSKSTTLRVTSPFGVDKEDYPISVTATPE